MFELCSKQYEIARIDESREGAVIQLIDSAQPPERKSKPKRVLMAIQTTLMSGVVLLLLLFTRRALRRATQTESPRVSRRPVGLSHSVVAV
jgi:tyrosine-protein kinase Etk/Wzc